MHWALARVHTRAPEFDSPGGCYPMQDRRLKWRPTIIAARRHRAGVLVGGPASRIPKPRLLTIKRSDFHRSSGGFTRHSNTPCSRQRTALAVSRCALFVERGHTMSPQHRFGIKEGIIRMSQRGPINGPVQQREWKENGACPTRPTHAKLHDLGNRPRAIRASRQATSRAAFFEEPVPVPRT